MTTLQINNLTALFVKKIFWLICLGLFFFSGFFSVLFAQQTAQKNTLIAPIFLTKIPKLAEPEFQDPDLAEPKNPFVSLPRTSTVAEMEIIRAYQVLHQSDLQQAVRLFQKFLRNHPQDSYTQAALFEVAKHNIEINEIQTAEIGFRKLLTTYSHQGVNQDWNIPQLGSAFRVPQAIYFLGQIAEKRGEMVKALYYYKEVMQKYPDASIAEYAKNRYFTIQQTYQIIAK